MDSIAVQNEGKTTEIKRKMKFSGKVEKISLAGALIDIGVNQPAVLHISQVPSPSDSEPTKRVEDVLSVGQEVEVWVKRVKPDHVELTMIEPLELEWRDIKPDMVVKGKVVRLEKFGAFIEIGAERPGLIHISELAHGYIKTPSEVVNEGDEVEAKILEINRRKKQIKLSMKALQEMPVEEIKPREMPKFESPKERVPKRTPKKTSRRQKRSEASSEFIYELDQAAGEQEQEPTAMEFALREAMERAKTSKKQEEEHNKREKSSSKEQEDILSRTLGQKVQS